MSSNLFFTSDLHLGHRNVIKHCSRPYSSMEEMDEALIKNWNATVSPSSTIWILGDVSFHPLKKTIEILNRLNGKKHLVYGNHDKDLVKNEQYLMTNVNIVKPFESMQDYKKIKCEGQSIILSHYAFRSWQDMHRNSIHLYGHSHNSLPPYGKSCDIGIDSTVITSEYRPVSWEEVKKFMSNREVVEVDHHKSDRSDSTLA